MAKKRDTTVFYQNQIEICKKYFNAEQFGRLMMALFEVEDGNSPEVADDIAIAFEFMSLQKRIDREKYEEKCRKNRENGKLGGRPKKGEKPKKANGSFKNPNDDDDEDDDEEIMMMNDEDIHDSVFIGQFNNVRLSDTERDDLERTYERTGELIDKVSLWLRTAKNDVPDHYGLCLKFAANDEWPKRRVIEPVRPIIVEDPLSEEEQQRKVADMRARLNGAIKSV